MTEREILKQNFLQKHNFAHYRRDKMKEDASFRKYERITTDHKTYLLMDAPPDKEKVIPFIEIGNFLYKNNFSAPEIIAQDTDNGFLFLVMNYILKSYLKMKKMKNIFIELQLMP